MSADWPEAPASRQAREQAYAAADARATGCVPPAILSPRALDRIIEVATLPLARAGLEAKPQLMSVLEQLAHRAVYREAFNGPALSIADDLEKMLRAWKRMHSRRQYVRKKALWEMRELVAHAAGKGSFGPIAPPWSHPEIFEAWLADAAFAHGVERELTVRCLNPVSLKFAEDKALRVAEVMAVVGQARRARRSQGLNGGAPINRERDLRTEKLLSVFWLLYGEEPNGAVAGKQPMRAVSGDLRRSTDKADGGAATRFVHAFEIEVANVIKDRAISDPIRKPGRPVRWKAESLDAVNIRLRRLLDWRAEYNEYGEPGPARAHERPWERWTLAVNAARVFLPMLARTTPMSILGGSVEQRQAPARRP